MRQFVGRHPGLVIALAVVVALVSILVTIPVGWVVRAHLVAPRGADSPMAAVGRLESALRAGDEGAVRRALPPNDPNVTPRGGSERAAEVTSRYGSPDFRFETVTLRRTESDSVMAGEATVMVGSSPRPVRLFVYHPMSLDTGGSLGWFASV